MAGQARQLAAEDGMTLVEVLVSLAIMVLIVGAITVGMVRNNDSALGVQRQAQLVTVLQNRIEYVRQLLTQTYKSKGFAAIALSSNPAKPTDSTLPSNPADPNDFIVGWTSTGGSEEFKIEKNYNSTSEGALEVNNGGEPLQIDTTNGQIAPVVYVDLCTPPKRRCPLDICSRRSTHL